MPNALSLVMIVLNYHHHISYSCANAFFHVLAIPGGARLMTMVDDDDSIKLLFEQAL